MVLRANHFKRKMKVPADLLSRKGRFKISSELFDADNIDNIEGLFKVMSNFLIVRSEYHFLNEYFEYTAISLLFKPIERGTVIPEYDIKVQKDDNGEIIVKAICLDASTDGAPLLRLLRKIDH